MKKIIEIDVSDYGQYEFALPYEQYYDTLQFEVDFSLEQVVDADTPFGPKYGTEITINAIDDIDLYTCDRDGGEAACYQLDDVSQFVTDQEILDLLYKSI